MRVLRDQHGRHFAEDGVAGDGRVRVRIAAPTPLMVAQHRAGWGALVEMLEPASVQAELARLGAELVRRYAACRESIPERRVMPSAEPVPPPGS